MSDVKVTNYNSRGEIVDLSKIVLSEEMSKAILEILNSKRVS